MRIPVTLAVLTLVCSSSAHPIALAVAPAVAPGSPTVRAPEDVTLAWKFKAGDVLRYRILTETHTVMSGMGDLETDSSNGQVIRQKVQSVAPDGTAKIECTWEAVKLHMTVPMSPDIDFDSTQADAKDAKPDAAMGFAKLAGSTFQMEMKPTGEIVSLHGVSDVMDKAFSGSDPSASKMKNMVARSFNDESMRKAMGSTLLPDKAVATGGTWKRDAEFDIPTMGKLKAHFDYTLAGTEDVASAHCAKVGVQYAMTLGGGKPDFSAMPGADRLDIDLTMDDAEGEGTIDFSPDRGCVIQSKLVTDMDMTMNMRPKGEAKAGAGEGMKMGIKMSIHVMTTLLGPEDPAFPPETKHATKADAKKEKGEKK